MNQGINQTNKKAVVLVSGGLDSATVLAKAVALGYQCYTLSFDYGQKHRAELVAAQKLAQHFKVAEHKIANIDVAVFAGSALTDSNIAVPEAEPTGDIPITYVPARNTVFLSYALAWAEVLGADDIFIGVNAVDYSGYPDCRPEFISAFEKMANLATKSGVERGQTRIQAPLQNLSKAEIISQGIELGVDYSLTVSCYQADNDGKACGACESCRLRKQGFIDANVADVTRYKKS